MAADARRGRRVWAALAEAGQQLIEAITVTVQAFELDARTESMLRADDDEERLARMLLAAAWYALNYRNAFAFPDTPLFQAALIAPKAKFTFDQLLEVPSRALVDDLLAQLRAAEDGPLDELRGWTGPKDCVGGPLFDGSADISADADLIVDGVLIDFKSTRNVHTFDLATVQQLLGYTLMDYTDRYKIDAVGVYLTRAGTLITWPLEEYLALLGARRRDLTELRAAFAHVLGQPRWRADDDPMPHHEHHVARVLTEAAALIPDGCCRVCAQSLPQGRALITARPRLYCSSFCLGRSPTLRRHGWLDP